MTVEQFDAQEFGRRLKIAAEWKGLDRQSLAAALGLHGESITRHMRGETMPNVAQLNRYLTVLGVSADALMDHSRGMTLPGPTGPGDDGWVAGDLNPEPAEPQPAAVERTAA
jgi:transcriptional regulator with XRE-family HTH domain